MKKFPKKWSKWYMAGTEGLGAYLVVVKGSLGRVGFRDLGGGNFRVRVEPNNEADLAVLAPFFPDWKQPDLQRRFSKVTNAPTAAITHAVDALATVNHLQTNPKAPKWAKELVAAAIAKAEEAAKAAEKAKKKATKKVAKPKAPTKKPAAKKAPAKKPTKKAA